MANNNTEAEARFIESMVDIGIDKETAQALMGATKRAGLKMHILAQFETRVELVISKELTN